MFRKNNEFADLDEAISEAFAVLALHEKTSDAYATTLDHIVTLTKIKNDSKSISKVSADVKLTVAAHLAGIGLIVGHERAHVVTSKALNFVQKLR